MVPFTAAGLNKSSFNCPFCQAYSNQMWSDCFFTLPGGYRSIQDFKISFCHHCGDHAFWHNENMIFPDSGSVPAPNSDLPDDIKRDYEEARSIVNKSPRGSAALLRLSIQKLCKHLGESGNDINKDIGSLVKKGLPLKVQQALDIVRVIGNNAVHPGEINLKDNTEIATQLFALVNLIADVMITQPKQIDNLFNSLPENKIEGIKNRDKL